LFKASLLYNNYSYVIVVVNGTPTIWNLSSQNSKLATHKFGNSVFKSKSKRENMAGTMAGTPIPIPEHNDRVVQRAGGGVPLREAERIARENAHWAEVSPSIIVHLLEMANARQFRLCRYRVNVERNEAFARGVHIVEDEALPRHFVLEELPDE
jgi:hypothetical protein